MRKSINRLSSNEKSRLRNAFERAIANTTAWMNFPDIANFHGAPFDVCPERGQSGMVISEGIFIFLKKLNQRQNAWLPCAPRHRVCSQLYFHTCVI